MAATPGPNPVQSDLHEAVNCLQKPKSAGPIVTIVTGSTVCRLISTDMYESGLVV